MPRKYEFVILFFFISSSQVRGHCQSAPSSSSKPWHSKIEEQYSRELKAIPEASPRINLAKTYSLAELVDFAEQHNPETRLAWQEAKIRATALGVARSELYPTLSATALAFYSRGAALFIDLHRQTLAIFQPTFNLDYTIFDFGRRQGQINAAKANLIGANFAFNDTHRTIIYRVTTAYYRLLDAQGQLEAAKATLLNAQTVADNTANRLQHGLATLPDLHEAQAAAAQANYDLQARIGALAIAQGDLQSILGLSPTLKLNVEGIDQIKIPAALDDSAQEVIDRAFEQRPDLMEQVARVRAADAAIKQAKSAYAPTLSFSVERGYQHGFGYDDLLPKQFGTVDYWNGQLNVTWTLFDGFRRENELAQANAEKRSALAQIDASRDQIAEEVWAAYSNANTALEQQKAAAALLDAAQTSYSSALESYKEGVRNVIDVVSAQRVLAQARSSDVSARTQLLTQIATLAFRTGDLVRARSAKPMP
jgi:outer membrane protein